MNYLVKFSAACTLITVGLVAFGFFLPEYQMFQLGMIVIYSLALIGLNILMGDSGQVSLGHGAFFALGAYTVAILLNSFDTNHYFALLITLVILLVFGWLFGWPALRFGDVYLGLVTFALAFAIPQMLKSSVIKNWTGASQGIVLTGVTSPMKGISDEHWLFLVTCTITAFLWIGIEWLRRSMVGRNWRAIRDDELAAEVVGVNVKAYKTLAFAIASGYAGVAGGLFALQVEFVSPGSFDLFLSVGFFIAIVMGGLGTRFGPIIGGILLVALPNLAEFAFGESPWLVYGVSVIVIGIFMPKGLGSLRLLGRRT